MDQPQVLVHLNDKVLNLTGQFIANGQVSIDHIDNGFVIRFITVIPQVMMTQFGPTQQFQATKREFYCLTVQDVQTAVGDLLQMPWRPITPDLPEVTEEAANA